MGATIRSSTVEILADPARYADALRAGDSVNDLSAEAIRRLAAALDAADEEEATAFMPRLPPELTGLKNAIWYSVKYGRHAPRIKIAVDPPNRISPLGGTTAVMSIETGEILAGELPESTRKRIAAFVTLIRKELLGYWNADETGVDEEAVKAAAKRAPE